MALEFVTGMDPFVQKVIAIAVLIIAAFVVYLYAITRVRNYAKENNLPLQKARNLENATKAIILLAAVFLAMNVAGAVGNIALSTSILGAVLILVSQSFLSSFVSGIYLLISRPFNYGDRIEIGSYLGDVVDIGIISTKIKTPLNEIITIPNSKFLGAEIKNYDIGGAEVVVEIEDVGVAYGTDLKKAKDAIIEVIKNYAKENPHLLMEPEPSVATSKFEDSSISLRIRFYVDDVRVRGLTSSEIRDRIKEAFDKNKIEIPFPQRVIYTRKE